MTYTEVIIKARIWKVWVITTKYLKIIRAKYRDSDLATYDKLTFLTIDFFRKMEMRIKEENLSLKDINFEENLKQMLQEEQKDI